MISIDPASDDILPTELTPEDQKVDPTKVNAAHILLDTQLQNSGLEGAVFSQMLRSVALSFQSDSSGFSRSLVSQLTECAKWSEMLEQKKLHLSAEEISYRAKELSLGESLLIPGGWKGDPFGHAMLYHLTRTENETFTFRVINTGAGTDHHIQIQGTKKTKSLLTCSYTNIPKKKLLYGREESDFFKYLLSFQSNRQQADFDPTIIYQGVLAPLQHYRDDRDLIEYDWLFITPQRSGTCSFKVVKAFVRLMHCLAGKSKKDYKSLSIDWREQTLRSFFKYAQNNPEDEQTLLMLKEMIRGFLHTLRKQYESIPEYLSRFIREVEDFLRVNTKQKASPSISTPSFYKPIDLLKKLDNQTLELLCPDPTDQLDHTFLPLPEIPSLITGDNAKAIAKQIIKHNPITEEIPYLLHHIDIFASKLSLNREDWKNETSFHDLYALIKIYHSHSILDLQDAVPRHFITLISLYYTLWAMLPYTIDSSVSKAAFRDREKAKNLIKTLVLPKHLFEQIDQNPFFLLQKPEEQSRFLSLRKAFNEWEEPEDGCSIFDGFFSIIGESGTPCTIIPDENHPESAFYQEINNLLSPTFKKKFEEELEYAENIAVEHQNQVLLATRDFPWKEIFSPFVELRRAHRLVGELAHNYHLYHKLDPYDKPEGKKEVFKRPPGMFYSREEADKWTFFPIDQLIDEKTNHKIEVFKPVDERATGSFFYRPYGYRKGLSSILKESFKIKSLRKNQEATTFNQSAQDQANSLESAQYDKQVFLSLTQELSKEVYKPVDQEVKSSLQAAITTFVIKAKAALEKQGIQESGEYLGEGERIIQPILDFLKKSSKKEPTRDAVRRFLDDIESAQDDDEDKDEIDVKKTDQDTLTFLKQLASLTTEPSLATFELLTLYSQHASILESADHQALFLTQLFKTDRLGKNRVQKVIDRSPATIAQGLCLLVNILETLALNRIDKSNHHLFLFSSYILSSASQYYPSKMMPFKLKEKLETQKRLIKKQIASLKGKGDKQSEGLKRLYHLHYLYALTSHPEKNTDDLVEIFAHKFALSALPPPKDNPYLFVEYDITDRIHTLLPILTKQNDEFLDHLAKRIITENKLDLIIDRKCQPIDLKIDPQTATITFRDQKNKLLEMHCSTGSIYYDGALCDRSASFNRGSDAYKLLFGSQIYPTLKVGNIKYLSHPEGTFREISGQISFQFKNQGSWNIFSPADKMTNTLPLPLRAGFLHFYNPDKEKWTLIKERNYGAFSTSLIWKLGEQKIYSYDRSFYYTLANCPVLETIERPNAILKKVYQGGETHLELPRYHLVFIADQGLLKLQHNPSFHLVEESLSSPTYFLQDHSLSLKDKSGSELHIFPRLRILAKKGLSRNGIFDMPPDERDPIFDWSTPLEQQHYSSCTISKNEHGETTLVPHTIEDTLSLAYYALHDRKFLLFDSLLKDTSPFDALSKESFSILSKIISYGSREKNHSPEVTACTLRAALLFYHSKKRIDPYYAPSREEVDYFQDMAADYLSTKSHIDKTLRLTQDEMAVSFLLPAFKKHLLRFQEDVNPKVLYPQPLDISIAPMSDYMISYFADEIAKIGSNARKLYIELCSEMPDLTNTVEARVHSTLSFHKHKDYEDRDFFLFLLLCIAAKREGKTLPKTSDSDAQQETFKNVLKSALKNVSYKLQEPTKSKVPTQILQTFITPHKNPYHPTFHPIDLSPLSNRCQPLWKTANLHRKEYDLPAMSSYSLPPIDEDPNSHYHLPIASELEKINVDIEAGAELLAKRSLLAKIGRSYGSPELLINTIEARIAASKATMKQAEKQVLDTVNCHLSSRSSEITNEQCRIIERTSHQLTIKELEHIFLWKNQDPKALKRAYRISPQFQKPAVQEEVCKNLCTYEQQAVTIIAYQKALDICHKLKQVRESEKESLYANLAATLETNLSVLGKDPQLSFLQMLIFARISKLIPREDQMDDLMAVSKGPCILQKIMGGGKTSVIAALWSFREALYEHKLPVIFAESSLYTSLGDNLKKSQKNAFGQDIFTIDCPHPHFDLPYLQQIEGDLKRGLDKKQVLVMRVEMLQALDLELQRAASEKDDHVSSLMQIQSKFDQIAILLEQDSLNPCSSLKDVQDKAKKILAFLESEKLKVKEKSRLFLSENEAIFKEVFGFLEQIDDLSKRLVDKEKKDCLRRILIFFKNHASTLGDEIDLLLRSDFEVNFPMGHKVHIGHTRVDLTRKIFTHLALDNRVTFKQETQKLLSKEELELIFEEIAKKLLHENSLCLIESSEEVKKDFVTFVSGKGGRKVPKSLNDYVKKLRTTQKGEEASELISLTYHIFVDILPSLFKKSPNLHFGRTNDPSRPGQVVPFVGVNAPSTREIGYHYEALCKQFYTAATNGIDLLQLKALTNRLEAEGKREVTLKKCLFQSTMAARYFKQLTGEDLDLAKQENVLKKALQTINKDPKKALSIEMETALKQVGHYQAYRTSSAQAAPNLVNSLRGMAGIPWNHEGYHHNMGELKKDAGAAGKILYTLLQRSHTTKIHTLEKPTIEALLDEEIKERKRFPDAILDMGALFKKGSIESSARKFLKYAQKKGISGKNAVLFFHSKKGESTKDRLAVGKFIEKTWKVELLENTRAKALRDKGLTIDECLTFFDQRHCTGSDIPLPSDAHGVITAGQNIELRTLLQTVMRERLFCSSQTANFALLKGVYDVVKKKQSSVKIEDLIVIFLINLAKKKADSLLQSFKQQINEVFIDLYRNHSRKGDVPEEVSKAYAPLLQRQITDSPYEQFFREKVFEDPIKVLEDYRKQRLALFNKDLPYSLKEEYMQAEKETVAIIKKAAEKKQKLPKKVLTNEEIQGKELETQVEQEQQQEEEQEISQELQEELETYTRNTSNSKAKHEKWWNDANPQQSIKKFIQAIQQKDKNHSANLLSAPEILNKVQYAKGRQFEKIFPNNILMTSAMQRSYDKFLTVFHPSQKIVEPILIVKKDNGHTFVILSEHEAKFLYENMPKNDSAWLVRSNGSPYLDDTPTTILLKTEEICKGLVYANLFAGRATPIEEIPGWKDYFHSWLKNGPGSKKDRIDYLALRGDNLTALDKPNRLKKVI